MAGCRRLVSARSTRYAFSGIGEVHVATARSSPAPRPPTTTGLSVGQRSVRRATSRIAISAGAPRVAERDAQQEAVELALRQAIGALLLDRVLRGDDHERRRQGVGAPVDGDLALLHRLEQRRLRLRRGAVDLVGEHDVGEQRTGLEPERLGRALRRCSRPTRSVGSRSGVNCTRFHVQSIDAASALARLVLPTPGTSSIEQVAFGEQADRRRVSIGSVLPWTTCAMFAVTASNSVANRELAPSEVGRSPPAWRLGRTVTQEMVDDENRRSAPAITPERPGLTGQELTACAGHTAHVARLGRVPVRVGRRGRVPVRRTPSTGSRSRRTPSVGSGARRTSSTGSGGRRTPSVGSAASDAVAGPVRVASARYAKRGRDVTLSPRRSESCALCATPALPSSCHAFVPRDRRQHRPAGRRGRRRHRRGDRPRTGSPPHPRRLAGVAPPRAARRGRPAPGRRAARGVRRQLRGADRRRQGHGVAAPPAGVAVLRAPRATSPS